MSRNTVKILGIPIISTSTSSVLGEITNFVANPRLGEPLIVFTPNPEFLVEANNSPEFKSVLNQANINLPDGSGLILASRFLGHPLEERISGADLVEKLLEVGDKKKWEVGIAGTRRGDQTETKILFERLKKKYPNIRFVNVGMSETPLNLPLKKGRQLSLPSSREGLRRTPEGWVSAMDMVFACHGMETQESWIMENKDKIKAKVFMGVGGSLDFLTGFTKRAPVWMRHLGLEWLWRGLQKPEHWKRIWQAVVIFPILILKEKLNVFLGLNS